MWFRTSECSYNKYRKAEAASSGANPSFKYRKKLNHFDKTGQKVPCLPLKNAQRKYTATSSDRCSVISPYRALLASRTSTLGRIIKRKRVQRGQNPK